ncbi:MAG: MBL fold metallo-hydrolase [Chrysiogenales bacterium]|nr:MAG: MBL fold metallo-hydrolase [Chrysiogenales bacterium]
MKKSCLLFLAFLFLNALLVRCDAADPVRVERLSERVLMLTEDSPMENIIVAVATKKGIVVIDSTGSPATAALFRKAIEKEFARNDFKYVIDTHPHWDHAWGNQVFPEAVVIGHENSLVQGGVEAQARTAANMLRRARERVAALQQGLQKAGNDADQKAKLLPELAFQERIVQGLSDAFTPVPPAISFSDTMALDMGDVLFKLYFFGRAHSGSDIFIHIPAEKILVSGDIFLDVGWLPLFSGMDTLDIPKWCDVLDRLFNEADGFSTVIPGHRKTWSRDKLKMWKEYIENLWTGINVAKKEKLTLAQVLERFPLEERFFYLKELGHSEQRIREFHERNVEAFWRQLLVPITPLIEQATAKDGMAAAIEKCRVLWRSQRDEYDFSERSLNQLGYRFLNQDDSPAAIELFQFIVELYPASANAYDSLGEACMAAGKKELAVRNYEKSLELDANNQNAKDMLQRLRQQ